jgi:hypothetical protein
MMLTVEWITPRQVAKWVEESIGEKVNIMELDESKWPSLKEAYGELWLAMEWIYTHRNGRDVELTNKLLPNALKTKDFVQSLGKKIIQ